MRLSFNKRFSCCCRLKWDEDNLIETSAERGTRQKITEPKTPFIHYDSTKDVLLGCSGNPDQSNIFQ